MNDFNFSAGQTLGRVPRIDPYDIVGCQFNELTVQSLDLNIQKDARGKFRYFYKCMCSCGAYIRVIWGNLKNHHTKSCGCLKLRVGISNPGWRGEGQISGYFWAQVRKHATRGSRTLPFTISMADAWAQFEKQDGRCALTGWSLLIEHRSHSVSTKTASLDRIDSNKGYEVGNIQWLHKSVNQMKWSLTQDQFIEVCRAVISHTSGVG
jgi:hypothetical protein